MEKVNKHFIFPYGERVLSVENICETRDGFKLYRGHKTLIIKEIFVTDNNIFFNGIFTEQGRNVKLILNELNVDYLQNEITCLSESFCKKIDEFFKKIKEDLE